MMTLALLCKNFRLRDCIPIKHPDFISTIKLVSDANLRPDELIARVSCDECSLDTRLFVSLSSEVIPLSLTTIENSSVESQMAERLFVAIKRLLFKTRGYTICTAAILERSWDGSHFFHR